MPIPASQLVQVNPSVIGGGGNALTLNGVMLTSNPAVPMGTVQPFASAAAVSAFFGALSDEAALANVYFAGRDGATVLPSNLFFSRYALADAPAYLRGASIASLTLAQLQAFTGTLSLMVNGVTVTSSSISLAAASSFSNAASLIQAAFTTPPFTVSYDSVRGAFLITTTLTGAAATISFATGSISSALRLNIASGAVTSQGAVASDPTTAMNGVVAVTQNFAAFMTTFEPDIDDKLAFAVWTNAQNKRFVYVAWDTDATAIQSGNTTAFGPQVIAAQYDGIVPVYMSSVHAAFVLGMVASLDFGRTNGRITFAYKSLAGLLPSVTSEVNAQILEANGYNFYGQYATANQGFTFFYPGSVSGQYLFLDEYVNEIYLNAQLQLALLTLLTSVPSIPYNAEGYALIDAAISDPIIEALNFGSIRPNVPLSAQQAANVNNVAGAQISNVLQARGWYVQIKPATAQVRAARQSPPMTLFYMDGGSIHKIVLASILIQ